MVGIQVAATTPRALTQEVIMRNLLALLAFAVLVFVGVGWWLDWYQIQSQTGLTGHQSLNIDINRSKISNDLHKGIEKLEEKKQTLQGTAQDAAGKQIDKMEKISVDLSKTQQ